MKPPSLFSALVFLVAAFFVFPASASADLYECNGTWTNKPCEGTEAQKVLPEIERPVDLNAEALNKKELLVGNLRLHADDAKRDFGVDLDITGIDESCAAENTTYEDCMNLVNNADDRLNERVNEARQAKEQERANKQAEQSASSEDSSIVVLGDDDDDDDDDVYVDDYGVRRHKHERRHEKEEEKEKNPEQPPQQKPEVEKKQGKLGAGLQRDALGRRR